MPPAPLTQRYPESLRPGRRLMGNERWLSNVATVIQKLRPKDRVRDMSGPQFRSRRPEARKDA